MSFEQLEELKPLLERIDALQREVDTFKAAHPDAYARIMESWAVESTYNSNNIEGSTLSLGETALLYEGVPIEAPIEDVRQAEGGFAALEFLQECVADKAEFSEQVVKRAHELVFAEAIDPMTRGSYRTVEVEITGTPFQPTPAAYVSERMGSLVSSITKSRKHAAFKAALFHLEFESIHPFVNANGRTGRLMSNLILMLGGYEPVNIQAESRARYKRPSVPSRSMTTRTRSLRSSASTSRIDRKRSCRFWAVLSEKREAILPRLLLRRISRASWALTQEIRRSRPCDSAWQTCRPASADRYFAGKISIQDPSGSAMK